MEKGGQEYRNVDLAGAARGVWIVKVPKYLSEKWNKAQGNGNVGKLKITKAKLAGGKPEVIFSLDENLAAKKDDDLSEVPRDHKFVLTGVADQNLALLSQEREPSQPGDEEMPEVSHTGRLAVEGKVLQRAECRPTGDASYMNLKRSDMERKNKPKRQIVHLENIVINYKPKAYHAENLEQIQRRKEEGKKSRLDKDKVLELLFAAFEKHQYYNVKDLQRITQQPITYLKEILQEHCIYNMKAPHRNMWELKPEFRHYQGPSTSSTAT